MRAGAIVGTVHSPDSLRAARRLLPGAVDWLELRVDHFTTDSAPLERVAATATIPLIVTVRHPAEGGQNALSTTRRRLLFTAFLPYAAAIDVELRSFPRLAGVIAAARAGGVQTIASFHDFQRTPSAIRLRDIVTRAVDAGAEVVKIATRADSCADLSRLLGLFSIPTTRPLSVMAMGQYGKVSRLLFAQAGSVLNYAYLGAANASGQWPVAAFRQRLAELAA